MDSINSVDVLFQSTHHHLCATTCSTHTPAEVSQHSNLKRNTLLRIEHCYLVHRLCRRQNLVMWTARKQLALLMIPNLGWSFGFQTIARSFVHITGYDQRSRRRAARRGTAGCTAFFRRPAHHFCCENRMSLQSGKDGHEATLNDTNDQEMHSERQSTAVSSPLENVNTNVNMSMHTNEGSDASTRATTEEGKDPDMRRKLHTLTICMVPPPNNERVWELLSRMRVELKDPGYYRWPPHANMLYPFIHFSDDELSDIARQLHAAGKQHEPFTVALNTYGTFGGRDRGVLWLYPDSGIQGEAVRLTDSERFDQDLPLNRLFKSLEAAFPMCNDSAIKGGFKPHMTLSHFDNATAALEAQQHLESMFSLDELRFEMDRFYLLQRKDDNGQFLRVADVGIGSNSSFEVFDPPVPFPAMPTQEEAWVYEERMKLKARRNGKRGRRAGVRSKRRPRWKPARVPDTPEIIAQKRAERKAKRERLQREEEEQEHLLEQEDGGET